MQELSFEFLLEQYPLLPREDDTSINDPVRIKPIDPIDIQDPSVFLPDRLKPD